MKSSVFMPLEITRNYSRGLTYGNLYLGLNNTGGKYLLPMTSMIPLIFKHQKYLFLESRKTKFPHSNAFSDCKCRYFLYLIEWTEQNIRREICTLILWQVETSSNLQFSWVTEEAGYLKPDILKLYISTNISTNLLFQNNANPQFIYALQYWTTCNLHDEFHPNHKMDWAYSWEVTGPP